MEDEMISRELTPVQVLDACIHFGGMAFQMYKRLSRLVESADMRGQLIHLREDERSSRSTLRAHRKDLFPDCPESLGKDQASELIGKLPNPSKEVRDREDLVRCLQAMTRFEEFRTWFFEEGRKKLSSRTAGIFLEIMARTCELHVDTIHRISWMAGYGVKQN